MKTGIYEAFSSLSKLINNANKKLDFEIGLINSQLVKEAFDEKLYNFLKKIIIPNAREDAIYLDYSFGIFLGFDIEITTEESNKSNSDFRSYIRNKIKLHIEDVISSINHQINKTEFTGYDFHIYIIPFSDLEKKRKEIIQKLT